MSRGGRQSRVVETQSKEETHGYSQAPRSERTSTLLPVRFESHSAVYGVSCLFLGAGRLRRHWSRGDLPLRGFDLQRETRREHCDHSSGEKSEVVVAHPGP